MSLNQGYLQLLHLGWGYGTSWSFYRGLAISNGNRTSTATLRDGTVVVVKGETVGVGQKAFVQGGEVKGAAPELAQYEVEV